MAWTTPTQRNTGDLITASIWNTDLKDNLRYLKGKDGQVTLEDDLIPNSASLTLGQGANPWGSGHFYAAYAGPRYSLHKSLREVVLNWEDDASSNYQMTIVNNGSGSEANGGSGQMRLQVDDDLAGDASYYNMVEQNNALDTSFNVARNPYMRAEFAVNNSDPVVQMFLGLRRTPGVALPVPTTEVCAGLNWNGAFWGFINGNGSGAQDSSGSQTVAANTRYVIEIFVTAAYVEYWKDGVLMKTSTTGLPTGDLEWQFLIRSAAGGGAGDKSRLTIGKLIVQEDLT
jgi:hypothetical protein